MLKQIASTVNISHQKSKKFMSPERFASEWVTSPDLYNRSQSKKQRVLLRSWRRKRDTAQQHLVTTESFLRDPRTYLANCNTSDLRVLNTIVHLYFQYGEVYCGQNHIAKKCGICRKTVWNALMRLERDGLIGHIYRGKYTTNLYYITPLFYEPDVQEACRGALRAFRTLGLSLLFLISSAVSAVYTQADYRDIYLESYRTTRELHRAATHQPEIGSGPVSNFTARKQAATQETAALRSNAKQCKTAYTLIKQKTRELMMHVERVTFEQMPYAVQYIARKGYQDIRYGLPLTPKGMIKLHVFSTPVLRKVYREYLQMSGTLEEPWRWFYNRCLEVAREQNDLPVFRKMYEMLDALGLSYDDAGVLTHTVPSSAKKAHVLPKNGANVTESVPRPDREAPTQRQAEAPAQRCQNEPDAQPPNKKQPWRKQSEQSRNEKIQQAIDNYLWLQQTNPGVAAQMYKTMPPEVQAELERRQQQSVTNEDKE